MSVSLEKAKIKVRNLQRNVPIDTAVLRRFAEKILPRCLALKKEKRTDLMKLREIFILIISDRRMASLHRQFLQESGPTDILTFSHGEIFISADTAKRHARQFRNALNHELQLYIVHGFLHLHGFDDRTKEDAQEMAKLQEQILARSKLPD